MLLNDVTLREGDQMPGRDYSVEQKVEAGRRLDRLGVEYLQAGFPVTGERDRRAIRRLAAECDARVVAIARANERDVEAAIESEADVVEVFAPVSDLHLEHAIGKSREEVFEMVRAAVDLAIDHGATAHLTLVDAFRTSPEHLRETDARFPDVEFLTLADTVGARTPTSVRDRLAELGDGVDLDRVGVHFHDDLGCATANALAAYEAGAGKADVSVASLGERAGNPALEEVVVAGVVEHDESFGVDEGRLIPACEIVLEILGEDGGADPRKAVLGEEVVEHESGIHTAAMLHEPSVFEPYDPARFGGERRLLFGTGTGKSGASTLLSRAGLEPTEERVDAFLSVLDEEGPVTEEEAIGLAESRL